MKKIAILCSIVFLLSACKQKTIQEKLNTINYVPPKVSQPPAARMYYAAPVVKADADEALAEKTVTENDEVADIKMAPPKLANASIDTSKKIIKEGEIRFETKNVNTTRKSIVATAHALGGYIEQDSQTKNEGSETKEYNLKVRVPSANFDKLLDDASGTADKIDSRNVNIKDVSAEYIDTKTRLDNKKKLEQRYLQLLGKASKISDMLQIEEKLEDIRSDVESTQGQLNFMTKQVAYSTLDITFYSVSPVVGTGTGLGSRIKIAALGGWEFLQSLFLGIIACWPGVIIAILALIWFNKRKKRKLVADVE